VSPTETPGSLESKLPPHHPPAALEARVVATLAERGLLAPASRPGRFGGVWRATAMIAAAVTLFAAGALTARAWPERGAATPDPEPRFALLLYGGSEEGGAAAEAARVDEYRRWAVGLAQRGHYVAGEKLGVDANELTSTAATRMAAPGPESLAGFFVVGASNASEAETIARSCPHLRHGGRIVIRPIEPT
jgi:hypothetical protein